jgi:hypothetical protein
VRGPNRLAVLGRSFRSAFAIRGGGADQDRKHEEHVQKDIAVVPVSTSSFFTKRLSRQVGQIAGGCSGTGSGTLRGAVISGVSVVERPSISRSVGRNAYESSPAPAHGFHFPVAGSNEKPESHAQHS